MTKIEEIQQAINSLSNSEYNQIRQWIIEKDLDVWDREMATDETAGKLKYLVKESKTEMKSGKMKSL